MLYDDWSEEQWVRHPRFFRGQRVLAFAQHPTQAKRTDAKEYKDKEFDARIVGPGSKPLTYEVVYDGLDDDGSSDEEGDDSFPHVFPFLPANGEKKALKFKALGTGMQMIRVPDGECTWDGPLVLKHL